MSKLATLLTDFGYADYFVGAMKGALLSVAPDASIIDITHDLPPHDIQAAAWTLANAYSYFPKGTVHVAVVDPGVGSSRRALAVRAGEYFFVGPDNGLFNFIFEREERVEAVELQNKKFFREYVSRTFHGRDVFAPIAGAILNGVSLGEFGDAVTDCVRLSQPCLHRTDDGMLVASVIHVDRFGNLVTNIKRADLAQINGRFTIEISGRLITKVEEFFAAEIEGKLFAIWGSAGHLEIVARSRSAANILNVERGVHVLVRALQN